MVLGVLGSCCCWGSTPFECAEPFNGNSSQIVAVQRPLQAFKPVRPTGKQKAGGAESLNGSDARQRALHRNAVLFSFGSSLVVALLRNSKEQLVM